MTGTTRLVIKWFAAIAGLVLGAYLVWGLRSLLVPAAVGVTLLVHAGEAIARVEPETP